MSLSEKEILARATYFLLSNDYAETQRMFPEFFKVGDLSYIDSVLKSSPYFDDFFIGNLVNGYTLKSICKVLFENKSNDYIETTIQSYLDERFDLSKFVPKSHPSPQPKNHVVNIQRLKIIWVWLINNPMLAAIVGGIISLIIGTIILRYYHII